MSSRDFTSNLLSASVVLRTIEGDEYEFEFGGRPDMVVGWVHNSFDEHEIGSGLWAEYIAGRERAVVTLAGGVAKSGKRPKKAPEPEPVVNASAAPDPRRASYAHEPDRNTLHDGPAACPAPVEPECPCRDHVTARADVETTTTAEPVLSETSEPYLSVSVSGNDYEGVSRFIKTIIDRDFGGDVKAAAKAWR